MKNKRIRFDDRFYFTALSFLLLLFSLTLLVLIIDANYPSIWGYIALAILFSLSLLGCYRFPKLGIHFNYKLGIIKYIGYYKIDRAIIRMNEISKIDFYEIESTKKYGCIPKAYVIYDQHNIYPYVYRNGKRYMFQIHLKTGEIVEIPYLNLFKTYSQNRVIKQEMKISKILSEFNLSVHH